MRGANIKPNTIQVPYLPSLNQYLDEELNNDEKRTILTKLFDEIVYEGNFVSVKYRFLAQSIANRSLKTKEILEDSEMLNQTTKKDPNDRGQSVEKSTQELLFPIWQGLQDDYRTYCGITSFSNRDGGNEYDILES